MDAPAILAQRELSYVDDTGSESVVVLTVFRPVEVDRGMWKGRFAYGSPIHTDAVAVAGIDSLQALLGSLQVACGYLRGTKLWGRVQWQDVPNCGLPWPHEHDAGASFDIPPPPAPNPGNLHVLTHRVLGCPDESGREIEVPLTVFMPFDAGSGSWKCAVALGRHAEAAPIQYGTGADFIEALLHALAIARAAFDAMVGGRVLIEASRDLLDCTGFPRKVGRSFWLDPADDSPHS